MKGAPILGDALALAAGVLELFDGGGAHDALRRHLATTVLAMADAVTLAVRGYDRDEALMEADARLQLLRGQIWLASTLDLVGEDDAAALDDQCDLVGRQLGGWLKQRTRVD